jgi:S-adenosylmethionine:tRNA ribosyltransferase-isomerase
VESLQKLINAEKRIAVGTTSLRVLETLYWMGSEPNRFLRGEALPKLYPYEHDSDLRYEDALQNLLMAMHEQKLDRLLGATEIMILPQYQIRSVAVLITNFHLPESTLLMIIASAIGPAWRKLYEHALNNEYRFLSYGDSSLLFLD